MRVLYDHLLTEDSLDLLTEAGDALSLRLVGYAGDIAVDGGLVPALQSEAGFDLLTESGNVLSLARRNGGSVAATGQVLPVTLAGTITVAGQAGTVAATGRVIARADSEVSGPRFIRVPKPLHGVITATGTHGAISGRGHLTLGGKATLHQPPGTLAGQGHVTLSGSARLTAPLARAQARGDVIDELALVLALAA